MEFKLLMFPAECVSAKNDSEAKPILFLWRCYWCHLADARAFVIQARLETAMPMTFCYASLSRRTSVRNFWKTFWPRRGFISIRDVQPRGNGFSLQSVDLCWRSLERLQRCSTRPSDRQASNQLGGIRGAVITMIYGSFWIFQIDLHSRLDDCVINSITV